MLRRRLESAFGAPVLDVYGSTECKEIAWQCPSGAGYHVNMESVVVELLGSDGREVSSGETGDVVVTTLTNRAMPLIRYVTGDRARRVDGPCPCGRGLERLEGIEGRMSEYLHLPGGALLSPYELTSLIETQPGVLQYQITHDSPDTLKVAVVLAANAPATAPAAIQHALANAPGQPRTGRRLPRDVTSESAVRQDAQCPNCISSDGRGAVKARVVHRIAEIEAGAWDQLCDDPVFSHGWFRALEESGVATADARHIILEDGDRILGILPCFVQRGDPHYTLAERLFGPGLAPPLNFIGIRTLPALVAYSPLAQRTALFLAPGVPYDQAVRVCLETMERIAREERLPVSAWMFVPGKESNLRRALHGGGYRHCFLAPYASWSESIRLVRRVPRRFSLDESHTIGSSST